jgi:hypothetical protein
MKKNEFEQQIAIARMSHENQLALSRVQHEHTMEANTLHHQHQIEQIRTMGEEIRETISTHLKSIQPIYELLGGEGTLALLRLQTEQMVAMATYCVEKAAEVAGNKLNADVEAKREVFQRAVVKTLLEEIDKVYFKGRDDADADADDDAAFAEAVASQVGDALRSRPRYDDEDDDLPS